MERREFIRKALASAVGVGFANRASADVRPCPPGQMAVAGGTANSTTCGSNINALAWMQDMAVNSWREISGTKLSDQPTMADPNGAGSLSSKQDAWCGWAINPVTSDVYTVGQGGHDDYWGNEVNRIRLSDAVPAWSQIVAPSLGSAVPGDRNYYRDGKPTSTHGYYTSLYIPSLNRVVRFPGGSSSPGGNPTTEATAFNVGTGQYDPASMWAGSTVPIATGGGEHTYVIHPGTGTVYGMFANYRLSRWNVGPPGSWTDLTGSFPAGVGANYTAGAVDTTRNKIFYLGGRYSSCHAYDIATNTFARIMLSGVDIAAPTDFAAWGMGLVYVPPSAGANGDKFFARIYGGAGSNVYVITPNNTTTWTCALLSTTGGSALPAISDTLGTNGCPFTKFLYASALGGCVFGPRWGTNLWFLRLHEV